MNGLSLRTSVRVRKETVIRAERARNTDTAWVILTDDAGMTQLTLHVRNDRDISRLAQALEALRDLQSQSTPNQHLEVTITSEDVQD